MANNDSDFGAFVSGFLIGGLVGAAVALLMAPQSGEETRTFIRDKGIEIRDQVETSASDARTRAEAMAKEARSTLRICRSGVRSFWKTRSPKSKTPSRLARRPPGARRTISRRPRVL